MVTSSTSRVLWVDVAKAFSILLVVLVHTVTELDFVGISSGWIDDAMPIMSTIRMPLFFTASGLFAVTWVTDRTWPELLNRKVAVLVWVFLIWQPVVLAYKLAEMWWLPNQPDNTLQTQIGKIVISPFRPNGELWFLWALALFFVLSRLTRNLPVMIKVGLPAAISIVWTYVSANLIDHDLLRFLGNGVNGVLSYYVFFIGAIVYAGPIKKRVSGLRPVSAVVLFSVWIAAGVAIELSDVDFLGLGFAIRLLAVAAGFALATLFVRVHLFSWLGANTLQVYVAHMVFIVVATIGIYQLGFADTLAKLSEIVIVLMLIVVTTLTILVYQVAVQVPYGRLLYEAPAWMSGVGRFRGANRRR